MGTSQHPTTQRRLPVNDAGPLTESRVEDGVNLVQWDKKRTCFIFTATSPLTFGPFKQGER